MIRTTIYMSQESWDKITEIREFFQAPITTTVARYIGSLNDQALLHTQQEKGRIKRTVAIDPFSYEWLVRQGNLSRTYEALITHIAQDMDRRAKKNNEKRETIEKLIGKKIIVKRAGSRIPYDIELESDQVIIHVFA